MKILNFAFLCLLFISCANATEVTKDKVRALSMDQEIDAVIAETKAAQEAEQRRQEQLVADFSSALVLDKEHYGPGEFDEDKFIKSFKAVRDFGLAGQAVPKSESKKNKPKNSKFNLRAMRVAGALATENTDLLSLIKSIEDIIRRSSINKLTDEDVAATIILLKEAMLAVNTENVKEVMQAHDELYSKCSKAIKEILHSTGWVLKK